MSLDVLSLITLYIHLSKKILTPEQTAEANEKYAMAKWLLANRETEPCDSAIARA